jgi:hypothetical protein
MLSVVMYSILSNVCFTLGYILPEVLPVYYLPKELLLDYLVAFGLAFGVNLFVIPVTSRTLFLVQPTLSCADSGLFLLLFVGNIRSIERLFDIHQCTILSSL